MEDIFSGGFHADKVIERAFKFNRNWGVRDRHFIAETVYECVRWWRYLWWLAGEMAPVSWTEETRVKTWSLIKIYLVWDESSRKNVSVADGDFPNWQEFESVRVAEVLKRIAQKPSRAVGESVPDWMDQRASEELGADVWEKTLPALNQKAEVVLRANRLKTHREALAKRLSAEEIETRKVDSVVSTFGAFDFPDALVLTKRKNVFTSQAFQGGWFEVQDGASQLVAPLLGVKPGMRVIDACAGAGGKTLHLASLMGNKGKILALDVEERKLLELRRRSSRAGADLIETHLIDSSKTIKRLKGTADALLLDVPCSGLGVLRRNPDTKWKLSPEELDRVRDIQKQILETYPQMVKPGGRMVYATCSILPSENERQVEEFLAAHAEWTKDREYRLLPQVTGFDGFYACVLNKNG